MIQVEGLGKRYRIAATGGRGGYVALRDVLSAKLRRPFARQQQSGQPTDFWALRDVSFAVAPGQVLGIIGRNGAGKSTLLKLLSRITEPTAGRIVLDGRVVSLLEVGTGFHPELSGRENVFLNGAILGMGRAEIARKFDEIVAFAGVETFLETPVKRYSSGMYMRLAFSVAAHLESEVMVIDEVLAVGDAEFQRRCLGKMGEVATSGRTVLFVSHNLNAIERLCNTALVLERGRVTAQGPDVRQIIGRYLSGTDDGGPTLTAEWRNESSAFNHPVVQPRYLAVVDAEGRPLTSAIRADHQVFVILQADIRELDPSLKGGICVFDQDSREILWSLYTDRPEAEWPRPRLGLNTFRCALPKRFFNEGRYRIEMNWSLHYREAIITPGENSPSVDLEIRGGLSDSPYWTQARAGLLAPEWTWERIDG